MSQITKVVASLYRVPLAEVLTDASHGDHTHFELVTTKITLDDGSHGVGYTYTGGKGGHAIKAMIEYDLQPMLIGKNPSNIELLYERMHAHIHYVGRGGIASFAISSIDIALWDIKCKVLGQPLWKVVGGASSSCNA